MGAIKYLVSLVAVAIPVCVTEFVRADPPDLVIVDEQVYRGLLHVNNLTRVMTS
jgi:hypothetical protein